MQSYRLLRTFLSGALLGGVLIVSPSAHQTEATAADPLAPLRELVELDLSHEVVQRFVPRVQAGGDLAHNAEALGLVSGALWDLGREGEAERLLAINTDAVDEAAVLIVARASLAMRRDDLDLALKLLLSESDGRTLARFPDRPAALILLARIFARRGDYRRAEVPAQRFLALANLHPEAHTAFHILAQAAIERGDADAAQRFFERRDAARQWQELFKVRRLQIRQSPDDPLPRLGLALLWMEVEQWPRAARILSDLLERWPDQARAWFHLAECERAQARTSEALRAYDRALRLDPDHAPSRANRALLLIALDRPAEAQRELEQLLAGPTGQDPTYAPAHLALARLLLESEGPESAAARYTIYRSLGGTEPL